MSEYAKDGDQSLIEVASEIRKLRESVEAEVRKLCEGWADDMFSFADLVDSNTFDREDDVPRMAMGGFSFRTALSMAYTRPSDTATAYCFESQRRLIVAASRAFCRMNPYWIAAKQARIAYNVGTGHTYSIIAREPGEKVDKTLARKAMKEINQFIKINRYRKVQAEKLTRGDRDGEYFLRLIEDREDGILRVRFVEPIAIQNPPGMGPINGVWFGIKFNDFDYEEPEGYFIRTLNYDGGSDDQSWANPIPAREIQHRKLNVDLSSPRGIPTTYALRGPLTQALSTATAMGKMADIRARVAMIRKQVNATLGQIQPLLLRNAAGQKQGAGGKMVNLFGLQYGTVYDTNDQRSYEFPAQNLETDKIVHSVKTDLQSAAAAMGFADFVLSAETTSAHAGALVKEGPMDKAVGCSQQDLIEDDVEVLERALQVAADRGRLPGDVLEQAAINVQAPNAIARNSIMDAQSREIYVRSGAMSTETMSELAGLDPDVESSRIKANPPPALVAAQAAANPGTGDQRSHQAPQHSKATARAIPAGSEAGPGANPQRAEEQMGLWAFMGGQWVNLQEHASDLHAKDKPTQAETAMAKVYITDEWLAQTKREILGLPRTQAPVDPSTAGEYEPGVRGNYLGIVDGQQVYACDFDAMMVKYDAPDLITAGNHMRWDFIPADKIVVDWSFSAIDKAHNLLHEVVETRLMSLGKWSYSMAHKYANEVEGAFMLELRPELAALKPS
jgi:hypothetical protein